MPSNTDYALIHSDAAVEDTKVVLSLLGIVDAEGNVAQLPPISGTATNDYLVHRNCKYINLQLDAIASKLADEGYPKSPAPASKS